MAVGAIRAFGEEAASYPLPSYTPFVAGVIGATIGCLIGRERTRLDNFIIGGVFTGLAAFRDPRANVMSTLLVACVEGALWGATDRLAPVVKEAVFPAEDAAHATA